MLYCVLNVTVSGGNMDVYKVVMKECERDRRRSLDIVNYEYHFAVRMPLNKNTILFGRNLPEEFVVRTLPMQVVLLTVMVI